jgi:hypothetical protein
MAVYFIFRKYRIEADNPTQATKKLLDAVEAHKEEDLHVSDSVREADEPTGTDKPVGWANSAKRQLLGK